MTFQEQIAGIFPDEQAVPEEYRLASPVHQTEYLINGEIRHWAGATHTVLSPVCVRTPQGVTQVEIGSYPLVGELEAMEALTAAVAAYNNGRGEWPTMSV